MTGFERVDECQNVSVTDTLYREGKRMCRPKTLSRLAANPWRMKAQIPCDLSHNNFNDIQFSLNFIDRLVAGVLLTSPVLKASPVNHGISFIHGLHDGLFDSRGRTYYEHRQNFTKQSLGIGIAALSSGSFAV